MSGTPSTARLPSRALLWQIIADVRGGMLLKDSLANRGYCRHATDVWRARVPGFAAAMDDARAVARARDPRKGRLLELITDGTALSDACARIGVSPQGVRDWARRDRVFSEDLRIAHGRRLLLAASATARRIADRMVSHGERVYAAADALGIPDGVVTRIHRRHPEAWQIIEAVLPETPVKRRSPGERRAKRPSRARGAVGAADDEGRAA